MKLVLPEIRFADRTPLVEALLGVIRQLSDRVQQLEDTIQQLRDEMAVLKGRKPKPQIKPSQLESPAPRPRVEGEKRPGSQKRSKNAELTIHKEVPLHPPNLPEGAIFKGFEPFVVQELKIEIENTRYLRARYELSFGGSVLAPLPADVLPDSHLGRPAQPHPHGESRRLSSGEGRAARGRAANGVVYRRRRHRGPPPGKKRLGHGAQPRAVR